LCQRQFFVVVDRKNGPRRARLAVPGSWATPTARICRTGLRFWSPSVRRRRRQEWAAAAAAVPSRSGAGFGVLVPGCGGRSGWGRLSEVTPRAYLRLEKRPRGRPCPFGVRMTVGGFPGFLARAPWMVKGCLRRPARVPPAGLSRSRLPLGVPRCRRWLAGQVSVPRRRGDDVLSGLGVGVLAGSVFKSAGTCPGARPRPRQGRGSWSATVAVLLLPVPSHDRPNGWVWRGRRGGGRGSLPQPG